jgi:hypothetical protein
MTVDWRNRSGGLVSEGPEIEKLDTSQEYTLKLVDAEYLENVTMKFKDDTSVVDRFKTVWQVEGHKTKVWLSFNLPLGFLAGNAAVNERSNIVKFAKRFRAVVSGQPFRLDEHFFLDKESGAGMRIRARLERQKNSDFYNLDFESIGPVTSAHAGEPKSDPDALMLKMLAEYQTSDEAMQAFMKFMPDEPISKFWLLWNKLQAVKAGPPVKNDTSPQAKNVG